MARSLFDPGIYSVLTSGSAIGSGWLLNFYTAGTATRTTTYNAPTAGSANANPVEADASGRFDEIWLTQGETVKWVLTDENGTVKVSVDNFLVASAAPTVAAGLVTFLAGTAALPIANGGTGATSAVNALAALLGLPLAGGTVTGNIVRSAKGVHPYFNSASATGGQIYMQAAGADPTANPGDIVLEW